MISGVTLSREAISTVIDSVE